MEERSPSPLTGRTSLQAPQDSTPKLRTPRSRLPLKGAKEVSSRIVWERALKKDQFRFKHNDITNDQVRIASIEPGKESDTIYVSLLTVSTAKLGVDQQYEALSYCWGPETTNLPFIHVRDANTSTASPEDAFSSAVAVQKLYIQPNLHQALLSLRHSDDRLAFWVDAICVNQDNKEEKAIQVSKMWQIYNRATRVCIWLGPAEERSNDAMTFIAQIVDNLEKAEELARDEKATQYWYGVAVLLRRKWFSRRWVVQELALAKEATVLCGDMEIPWRDFKDAISLFVCYFDQIRGLFRQSSTYKNDFFAVADLDSFAAKVLVDTTPNMFRKDSEGNLFEPTMGLEYLVSSLSAFDSSDPRDTIIALQNIALETSTIAPREGPGAVIRPPVPEYTKDLLEVYTDFVRWVLESSKSLDIICRHWALPEKKTKTFKYETLSEKLPSWIQVMWEGPYGKPDGSLKRGRKNGDSFVGLPGKRRYKASYRKAPEVKFGVDISRSPTPPTLNLPQFSFTAPSGNEMNSARPQSPVNAPPLITTTLTNKSGGDQVASDHRDFVYEHSQHQRPSLPSGLAQENMTSSPTQLSPITSPDTNLSGLNFNSLRPGLNQSSRSLSVSSAQSTEGRQRSRISTGDTMNPRSRSPRTSWDSLSSRISRGRRRRESQVSAPEGRDPALHVKGLQIGEVSWKSDAIPDGVIPQLCLKKAGWYGSETASVPEKLWRTLVADRGPDGIDTPSYYFRACYHCLVNDTINGHINTKDLMGRRQPSIVQDYLKRVQAVTWNRKFLEAKVSQMGQKIDVKEKLFGLEPPETKVGDVVCILFGCSVPVILRDNRDSFSQLVGEAYIYGKMDGEAVFALSEEKLEDQTKWFKII